MKQTWMICLLLFTFFIVKLEASEDYEQPRYVKIIFENDMLVEDTPSDLSWTDYYYTNGSIIEISSPFFKFSKLFLIGSQKENIQRDFKMQIGQKMYTPAHTTATFKSKLDQPFAGISFLKFISNTTNTRLKFRLNSALALGVIGPNSLADKTQKWVHERIDYSPGNDSWVDQIGNGLLLDYQIGVQNRLIGVGNFIEISSDTEFSVGSIDIYAQQAIESRIGILKSRFTKNNKKFSLEIIGKAYGRVVGYNGRFSGSLIPFEDSPYTLPDGEVSRFTHRFEYGAKLGIGSFEVSFTENILSKEFSNAKDNIWGSLQVTFGL